MVDIAGVVRLGMPCKFIVLSKVGQYYNISCFKNQSKLHKN